MRVDGEVRLNPYVGPRAFERGERLYGRRRETQKLRDLLIAERIVLLHSPSGAGKTSLVQAGLVPELTAVGFEVLEVARVHREPPTLDGRAPHMLNRFVLSVLLSLEAKLPADQQMALEQVAGMELAEYLARRLQRDGNDDNDVLIFDQFEEILTTAPTDQDARLGFFAQVGAALRDRNLWALFSMREDYVASLSDYLRPIPTRLGTTFRLDLLTGEQAIEAVRNPAGEPEFEVDFSREAAEQLVRNLSRIRVHGLDGPTEAQGRYVEPVQLQVVCRRLWDDRRPRRGSRITPADLDTVGTVDQALAGYYETEVAAIAGGSRPQEWRIREWFDQKLITPGGIRGQVLLDAGDAGGIDEATVQRLVRTHLVRAEPRRGAVWLELAHDRLIEPIRQANADWRDRTLNTLQSTAAVWLKQERPRGLLLGGQALREAERWARTHPEELAEHEQEFLGACRQARAEVERERSRNRVMRLLLAAMAVLFMAALAATGVAYRSSVQAMDEAARALSRQLAAQGVAYLERRPDLALLLSVHARRVHNNLEARSRLLAALEHRPQLTMFMRDHDQDTGVQAVAFSPDGRVLASAGSDRKIILSAPGGRPIRPPLGGHSAAIHSLAISPDGKHLASGDDVGAVILWDLQALRDPQTDQPAPRALPEEIRGRVQSVAFSRDNRLLAAGGCWEFDGSACRTGGVYLWEVASGRVIGLPLRDHTGNVLSLVFSPSADVLATGGADRKIMLWDVTRRAPLGRPLDHNDGEVWSLAFSPDGRLLASGASDSTVRLWDVQAGRAFDHQFRGHTNVVTDLAFSPDGKALASASADMTVRLWTVADGQPIGLPLSGHTGPVLSVAFGPDNQHLASGGLDGNVVLWDRTARSRLSHPLFGHPARVRGLALSPDGRTLASGAEDNRVVLWSTGSPPQVSETLVGHTNQVTSVAFSPVDRLVASASGDRTIILWDAGTGEPRGQALKGHRGSVLSLAFSPDGRRLASGGSEGPTIRLWDIATYQPISEALHGPSSAVWSLAFSPDGRTVASGDDSGRIMLWEVESGRPIGPPIEAHVERVTGLAFTPVGNGLLSGGLDKKLALWDLTTPQPTVRWGVTHTSRLHAIALSRDGRTLATGDDERNVVVWNPASGERTGEPLTGHRDSVWGLSFDASGQLLASGGADGSVRLWNLVTRGGEEAYGHRDAVWTVAVAPDGKTLASGADNGSVSLWAIPTGSRLRHISKHSSRVNRVAFSRDGRLLASAACAEWGESACRRSTIGLWDPASGEAAQSPIEVTTGDTRGLAFSPAADLLASAGGNGTVSLWEPSTGLSLRDLHGHAGSVGAVAFSPDGALLASGSDDDTARVWEVATGRQLGPPISHDSDVRAVAFSPNGGLLALGTRNGMIRLLPVGGGQPLEGALQAPGQILGGHAGAVLSLAFSPDGATLASGSQDMTIRLWDVASGHAIGPPLEAHDDEVESVAFSPDGKVLLSSGEDGNILRWAIDLAVWEAQACQVAARDLTPLEWEQNLPGKPRHVTCANELFRRADAYALAGDPQAEGAFAEAARHAAGGDDVLLNNTICWFGSIEGFARSVLAACQRAVEIAPEVYEGQLRDSRGVARAVIGDIAGALDDFRFFLEWSQENGVPPDLVAKRREWIRELEAGHDPFADRANRRALRAE